MAFWPFKSAIEKHLGSTLEEKIFEQIARELQANDIRAGIWTKAYSECNGDPVKTKSRYIKLRAASIREEAAARNEILSAAVQVNKQQNQARIITCPFCGVNLSFHDKGEMQCRCPKCKITFRLDDNDGIYDIGCGWD